MLKKIFEQLKIWHKLVLDSLWLFLSRSYKPQGQEWWCMRPVHPRPEPPHIAADAATYAPASTAHSLHLRLRGAVPWREKLHDMNDLSSIACVVLVYDLSMILYYYQSITNMCGFVRTCRVWFECYCLRGTCVCLICFISIPIHAPSPFSRWTDRHGSRAHAHWLDQIIEIIVALIHSYSCWCCRNLLLV